MRRLKKFPTLGFLLLAGVWPAAIQGQTLSSFKMLPEAAGTVTAATGGGSGIYVIGQAGADWYLTRYLVNGVEFGALRFPDGMVPLSLITNGSRVYVAGSRSTTSSFLQLYDEQGRVLWTRDSSFTSVSVSDGTSVRSPGLPSDVLIDSSGVYVGGTFLSANGRDSMGYLQKLDPQGVNQWTKFLPNLGPIALTVDTSGVYVRGKGLFRKYDRAGAQLWTRSPNDASTNFKLAVNPNGVYESVGDPAARVSQLSLYDTAGNPIWVRSLPDVNLRAISVDADSVYTASSTMKTLPGQCASGESDAAMSRYDATGKALWTRQFGTYQGEFPVATVTSPNHVYVALAMGETLGRPSGKFGGLGELEKAAVSSISAGPAIYNECVVNAASFVGGAVSPGEIVSVFGTAIGPAQAVSADLSQDRPAETLLSETRVLFDGVAAPLLFVSAGQINAIVPNAVTGRSSVAVQVEYRGVLSKAVTLPVIKAHPGLFAQAGEVLVFNEDGTLNSGANPARHGSIVVLYGTGGGETDPASIDGRAYGTPAPKLKSTVLVASSTADETACQCTASPGKEAIYAGGVAGFVAGLMQINVRVLPEFAIGGTGYWYPRLHIGGEPAEAPSLWCQSQFISGTHAL